MSSASRVLACMAMFLAAVGCGGDMQTSSSGSDAALVAKAREIVKAVDEGRWEDARKDFDANIRVRPA